MKKSTKITLATFILLFLISVPLYYFSRPQTLPPGVVLEVNGKVNNPLSLTMTEVKFLNSTTMQVTLTSSSKIQDNGVFNYTGITLQTLLKQADIQGNATSIYIQASDGYGYSLTIQDANSPTTIIAYQKDGAALTPLKSDGEGPLRLIIGSDQYAQRWVRGVVAVIVN
jgi:DMSO/TMAO reductase YedYZ molybdopterin-dependent catalytic subunit